MVTHRERTAGDRDTLPPEGVNRVLSRRKPGPLELSGFVLVPEHRSAVRAVSDLVRRVVLGRQARVVPVVLHGLPGTGKTHLISAALEMLATESPTATGRTVAALELARPDDAGGFADADLAACDLL